MGKDNDATNTSDTGPVDEQRGSDQSTSSVVQGTDTVRNRTPRTMDDQPYFVWVRDRVSRRLSPQIWYGSQIRGHSPGDIGKDGYEDQVASFKAMTPEDLPLTIKELEAKYPSPKE